MPAMVRWGNLGTDPNAKKITVPDAVHVEPLKPGKKAAKPVTKPAAKAKKKSAKKAKKG